MKITRDPAAFRPVTIRLESEDEVAKLVAVVSSVARHDTNHTPQLITAAQYFNVRFCRLLKEDN